MPSTRLAAVGAFVIGGILLFAVGLFMIGNRRLMFTDTIRLYAEFSEIASLDNGAKVRVAGMDAGEVESIRVPASPSGHFRVRMRVRSDLRPLLRLDSIATIQNDGLVGNKFVQIEAGSEESPMVQDQGTIQSREPFDIADLMQKMSDTIDTVNVTIGDLKGQVEAALTAISDTALTAQDLIDDVGGDARAIMTSASKVSADLQDIVAGLKEGRGTAGRLLTDDALFKSAKAVAEDAQKAMADVRTAAQQAREIVEGVRGNGGPMKGMTGNLQQTLASARDVVSDMQETTEALKRNFLVRGYFNRRGYFDLDEVSVSQYRQGALEGNNRRALRIWIRGDLLFEKDANGREQLSEGGRQRLDSAMSQFVKYPRPSPFVVEGYAKAVTAEERFLISRARAQLVREYVAGRYGLNPNSTAVMPMGDQAADSPDGNTWDGIALAAFVPRSATR